MEKTPYIGSSKFSSLNKNATWDLESLSLNSHTPFGFLWECVSFPLTHVKPYGLSSFESPCLSLAMLMK